VKIKAYRILPIIFFSLYHLYYQFCFSHDASLGFLLPVSLSSNMKKTGLFSGHQMRALVVLSEKTLKMKGNLQLNITSDDDVTSFNFYSE
jgi:hypothetical protein